MRKRVLTDSSIRVSKRVDIPRWEAWLIRLASVVAGLLVSGLVIFAIFGINPLEVYKSMFEGVFGVSYAGKTLYDSFIYSFQWLRDTSILLLIAIGLAPAFKMRFWNIGAEGQMLVGGIAAAACMIYLGNLGIPNGLLLVIMALASLAAGALWGIVPALAKSRWNTNETLFTLMMNYIAIQFAAFFMPLWEHPKDSNTVGIINTTTKAGWFPPVIKGETYGTGFFISLLLVVVMMVLMYIYLRYSKQGYEISVVGESENTARYSGISVKKVVVRSMTISSAICGLAGFLAVAAADHTISAHTAGGRGFTAIIVAWLAKFNPYVMALIAAFLVFMDKGAIAIATAFRVSNDFSNMITGIILFFILGCEFFINYRVKFNFAKKEAGAK